MQAGPDDRRFETTPSAESHFSWLRTRLSVERTLMSWIRTSIASIGFGFTIVQFFDRLAQFQGVQPAVAPHGPRYLGLALIGAGLFGLGVSVWQYRKMLGYLWEKFEPLAGVEQKPQHTPTLLLVAVLLVVGSFAFVAVLLRLP